jgi:hypothetical protein
LVVVDDQGTGKLITCLNKETKSEPLSEAAAGECQLCLGKESDSIVLPVTVSFFSLENMS